MRPPSLVAVLLCTAACVTWEPQSVAPAMLVEDQHPKQIRITRTSGRRLVLKKPRVVADSIAGKDPAVDRRVAVAVSDVTSLETGHVNVGGSLLVLSAVLALGMLLVVVYVGRGLN